jgi:hypothetical protein
LQLFHFEAFVGEDEFFHRDVGSFGVEVRAGEFGRPSAEEFPRENGCPVSERSRDFLANTG